jgi:hypothetical protein
MADQPTPWRLQLSVRTLLELTAVAAVILAFWFTRGGQTGSRYQIVTSQTRGIIIYDSVANKCWQFIQEGGKNSWQPFDGPPREP